MNADASQAKSTTPPRRSGRTLYQRAIHYATRSRHYYDLANKITDEFRARAEAGEFGHKVKLADIAASESYEWRIAVQDQQFMERLANLDANIATMDFMAQLWQEQKETNRLLKEISQKLSLPSS